MMISKKKNNSHVSRGQGPWGLSWVLDVGVADRQFKKCEAVVCTSTAAGLVMLSGQYVPTVAHVYQVSPVVGAQLLPPS